MLSQEMIAAVTPMRGTLFVTRFSDAGRLVALAEGVVRQNPERAISTWCLAVQRGRIVGKILLEHDGRVSVLGGR